MQCRETIALYSERRTEHISTLCGKVEGSLMLGLVVHVLTTEFYRVNLVSCHLSPSHKNVYFSNRQYKGGVLSAGQHVTQNIFCQACHLHNLCIGLLLVCG
jgi:hypothetical protein